MDVWSEKGLLLVGAARERIIWKDRDEMSRVILSLNLELELNGIEVTGGGL